MSHIAMKTDNDISVTGRMMAILWAVLTPTMRRRKHAMDILIDIAATEVTVWPTLTSNWARDVSSEAGLVIS